MCINYVLESCADDIIASSVINIGIYLNSINNPDVIDITLKPSLIICIAFNLFICRWTVQL